MPRFILVLILLALLAGCTTPLHEVMSSQHQQFGIPLFQDPPTTKQTFRVNLTIDDENHTWELAPRILDPAPTADNPTVSAFVLGRAYVWQMPNHTVADLQARADRGDSVFGLTDNPSAGIVESESWIVPGAEDAIPMIAGIQSSGVLSVYLWSSWNTTVLFYDFATHAWYQPPTEHWGGCTTSTHNATRVTTCDYTGGPLKRLDSTLTTSNRFNEDGSPTKPAQVTSVEVVLNRLKEGA